MRQQSLILLLIVGSGCIPVTPQMALVDRRAALDFGCEREQIRCEAVTIGTMRCSGCGQEATYVCDDDGACRREHDPQEPQATASTRNGSQGSSWLSRDEVSAVLSSLVPEVRGCLGRAPEPIATALRLQVNGDGTAIYLGAEPTPEGEVSGCLRQIVNTLRFRATGAAPMNLETPEFPLSGDLPPLEELPPAPTEGAGDNQSGAPPYEAIRESFTALIPQLQQCYEGSTTAPAEASIRIRLAPNGDPTFLQTTPSAPSTVNDCLNRVIAPETFPPLPSGRPFTINPTIPISR